MRTLVTGADGFAGSHLVELLASRGDDIIALVRERTRAAKLLSAASQVRIEEGDVRDSERIHQLLRDLRPQRIYHLAAMSSPADSVRDPRLCYAVNFSGTLNILCAWRELQFDCRLLYVSSASVYGQVLAEESPLREDTPLRPDNPYAGSKAASEMVALQFFHTYQLPIVRVRPFNHTGPRQSEAFVCSSLAKQIAEFEAGLRSKITVGNVKVRRDFSDVRDIVRGYRLLLENGSPGEVYHLCSGRAVSIEEALRTLLALASRPVEVVVDQSKIRGMEAGDFWGDASKAREAVGWSSERDWKETLRDVLLYWRRAVPTLSGCSRQAAG